jgi:RimJ/RimL family protein N-acetyltransferase
MHFNWVAETKRCKLREFDVSDAVSMYELNSNAKVLKYTGDIPFENVSEAELFLEKYQHYALNGFGRWAVMEKKSNIFIGWCGLRKNIQTDEVDLGFRFFETYWNQGFATETALACLTLGFEKYQLRCIYGNTAIENKGSMKVLQKLGMKAHAPIRMGQFEGLQMILIKNE